MKKVLPVIEGDFGENILLIGIDFKKLPVGTKLICNDAKFEITQIGKECHSHCEIYKRVGNCIMPREGIFAKVLESGTIKVGDKIEVIYPEKDMPYMAAVMTLSDKGSRGERVDTSGPRAAEILKEHGFKIVEEILLPDEEAQIKKHLIRLSDSRQVDLIITTGGTGLSSKRSYTRSNFSCCRPQCAGNLRSDQSRFYDDHKTSHVIKRCQCNKKENIDH